MNLEKRTQKKKNGKATFQASFLPTSTKQEKTYPRKIGAKQQPLSNDWQSSVGGVKSRAGGVKQDQLERNPSC